MHVSNHDREVARIANEYPKVHPETCAWCKSQVCLPIATSTRVERGITLAGSVRVIPDITAVDDEGEVVAIVEVVDTHPPRVEALEAMQQAPFPTVIVHLPERTQEERKEKRNRPRRRARSQAVYCSAFCWVHQDEQRMSTLEPCACCQRYDFRDGSYHDRSDDPHSPHCLRCAASQGGQWSGPMGEDEMFSEDEGLDTRFRQSEIASFWSMVWTKREVEAGSHSARQDESRTTRQLEQMEAAFSGGDWQRASELLLPIGSGWTPGDRGESDLPLYAWEPKNCRRTSEGWRRLYTILLSRLPDEIQEIKKKRGRREDGPYQCFGCGRLYEALWVDGSIQPVD